MGTLQQSHDALWESITARVDAAVSSGVVPVDRFFKYRVGSANRDPGPYLVVLGRRLSPIQSAVHWRLGSLEVEFGVLGASLLPEDNQRQVVDLMFRLVALFLNDTTLEGRAKSTSLVDMVLDDILDPSAEEVVHSRATLAWQFEYMDNVESGL